VSSDFLVFDPDIKFDTYVTQPVKCLTTQLAQTYSICDPSFRYEATHNPRRVLTKPSQPCHNNGSDNTDYDYILYVNDVLTADNGTGDKWVLRGFEKRFETGLLIRSVPRRYLILDVLGQGTFGQVAKCQNIRTHEIVAVKVVKNKPAYFNQSTMEVAILQLVCSKRTL
jgi:dual specificity protein kinase YAK1